MEDQPTTGVPSLGLGVPGLNLGGSNSGGIENKAPGGLGLGFNLGNLEDLREGKEDKQTFSWQREFETIPDHSVTSKSISENVDKYTCLAKIVTLENETFDLECSMSRGIKVLDSDSAKVEAYEGKKFDSLEAFLMNVSSNYIQAMQSDK